MPSLYAGNPTAAQSPAPAPIVGAAPEANLPIDSDVPNSSSIYQPHKEAMDWIAFLSQRAREGVTKFSATASYLIGDFVRSPSNGRTYVCKADVSSGTDPSSDGAHWELWGHTDTQANALIDTKIGTLSGAVPGGGITSSETHCSVGYAYTLNMPGTTIKLLFCRLTFDSVFMGTTVNTTTLTLHDATAFANGADNVLVSSAYVIGGGGDSSRVQVRAFVASSTTVTIQAVDVNVAYPLNIEIVIQGH